MDDPCLWFVPCSQRRYRTDEERECLVNARKESISGEQRIDLKRGQTLFWSGNIIHRGRVPEGVEERITLATRFNKYLADEPLEEVVDERHRWRMANNIRETLPAKVQLYIRSLARAAAEQQRTRRDQ